MHIALFALVVAVGMTYDSCHLIGPDSALRLACRESECGVKAEEHIVEKCVIKWSYWAGVIALVLALLFRTIDVVNPKITLIPTKGHPIGYNTFLHGALLFFVATIASACSASFKSHGSKTLLEEDAIEHDPLDEILRDFVNNGCAQENGD